MKLTLFERTVLYILQYIILRQYGDKDGVASHIWTMAHNGELKETDLDIFE